MKPKRILPVLLAGMLQVMPMLRTILPVEAQGFAPSAWAIVVRLAGGAVAFLGSYHAVSAATAVVGPYTINATVGVPFLRQLTTSGQTAHSWSTTTAPLGSATFPIAPGLVLTNSNGRIAGTPTTPYATNLVISAWENSGNKGASVSATFTITVTNATGPPSIVTQPQSQTNLVGTTANFLVAASGTPPLGYQWRFNGAPISGATSNNYSLANVQTNNGGNYSVTVTNSSGTTNSANALLTVVVPSADVAVNCAGPANAVLGNAFNYTVTITNLGPNAAANVVVSDTLPSTATFNSASGGGIFSSGVVTWPAVASLASGAGTSYTVTVTPMSAGSITDTASATSGTTDPNPANNNGSAAASRVVTAVTSPQADVTVACTGPGIDVTNSAFTYTITVSNAGPSTATNVVLTDALPSSFTFVSASGGGILGGGAVSWPTIATLASGSSANYTVTVTAATPGIFTNVASAVATTPDPNSGNNDGSSPSSSVVTTIASAAQADLVVLKSGVPAVLPGSNLTYTITVSNLGPSMASNIVVSDNLPASVGFVSASASGNLASRTVSWPAIPNLTIGGATSYTVTVTAPASGTFTNVALAVSATTDPNPTNNNGSAPASQVVTTVVSAAGQFGILAVTNGLNPQSGLYEESVTITNTGLVTAAAVRLYVDGLRVGIQLYNAAGYFGGRPYVQYNAPLNPNQTVTLLLEFYVPDRGSYTHVLSAIAVMPANLGTSSAGSAPINRVFVDNASGAGPRFVIEFNTIPGNSYTIIYSDDSMVTWFAATPSITAAATVTQWFDDGPPKTLTKPLSNGSRFYKVIAN